MLFLSKIFYSLLLLHYLYFTIMSLLAPVCNLSVYNLVHFSAIAMLWWCEMVAVMAVMLSHVMNTLPLHAYFHWEFSRQVLFCMICCLMSGIMLWCFFWWQLGLLCQCTQRMHCHYMKLTLRVFMTTIIESHVLPIAVGVVPVLNI